MQEMTCFLIAHFQEISLLNKEIMPQVYTTLCLFFLLKTGAVTGPYPRLFATLSLTLGNCAEQAFSKNITTCYHMSWKFKNNHTSS